VGVEEGGEEESSRWLSQALGVRCRLAMDPSGEDVGSKGMRRSVAVLAAMVFYSALVSRK
jgi:hypothetical protein